MPGRRPDRISDPYTHQPQEVCLRVAAEYLGCSPRTLKRLIRDGCITALHYDNIWRISVLKLAAYKRYHTEEGTDAA